MSFTNYLENAVLGHVFGASTFSKPSRYVGLFTAAPGEAGGGTELSTSGTGYARQSADFTVSGSAPTQATNTAAVEFPTASTSWGTVTHVGVFDADTGGNLLAYAALSVSKTIGAGDVFRFPASQLTFTLE
jgi:hypothetical protein